MSDERLRAIMDVIKASHSVRELEGRNSDNFRKLREVVDALKTKDGERVTSGA